MKTSNYKLLDSCFQVDEKSVGSEEHHSSLPKGKGWFQSKKLGSIRSDDGH